MMLRHDGLSSSQAKPIAYIRTQDRSFPCSFYLAIMLTNTIADLLTLIVEEMYDRMRFWTDSAEEDCQETWREGLEKQKFLKQSEAAHPHLEAESSLFILTGDAALQRATVATSNKQMVSRLIQYNI